MQLGLTVLPSIPPNILMETLRTLTSEKILSNFGWIGQENAFNDFWADGHLLVPGTRLQSTDMVQKYITFIRKHQGPGV